MPTDWAARLPGRLGRAGAGLAPPAVLGFVQERQAERATAALQRMAAPAATVIRDGAERRVPADEVVIGDLLALAEGDAVPAHGRLLFSAAPQPR